MTILVTGVTGFVGHAVASALQQSHRTPLRTLVRDVSRSDMPGQVLGDVRDALAVRTATEGVDTLVHAATYVGRDPTQQFDVNVEGTRTLVRAAVANGVARILYVSTTSVYGTGPHRGERDRDLGPHPESALSASRAQAEQIVLDAGGCVVRSALTYGAGDRWFIPGLIRVTRLVGGLIGGGAARTSIIRVDHLGSLVAAFTGLERSQCVGGTFVAANVRPVAIADVVRAYEQSAGGPVPRRAVTFEDAEAAAAPAGVSRHQLALLGLDHWYDATDLWGIVGLDSPRMFELRPEDTAWYRAHIPPEQAD